MSAGPERLYSHPCQRLPGTTREFRFAQFSTLDLFAEAEEPLHGRRIHSNHKLAANDLNRL